MSYQTNLQLMAAARVPHTIEPQKFGLWEIRRVWPKLIGDIIKVGFNSYTLLHRWSSESLHQEYGDVVMEDSVTELRNHIPIWRAGHGNVLITGLGLGCVVRGLLAKSSVTSITVVEIDHGIIRVVGKEFEGNPRVTIVNADALTWLPTRKFNVAWHDIEKMNDEQPHLSTLHIELLGRYAEWANRSGAWGMPRWVNRFLPRELSLHAGRLRKR